MLAALNVRLCGWLRTRGIQGRGMHLVQMETHVADLHDEIALQFGGDEPAKSHYTQGSAIWTMRETRKMNDMGESVPAAASKLLQSYTLRPKFVTLS